MVQNVTPASGGGGSPVAGQNCVFWDFVNQVWIVPFIDGNYPTVDGGVPLSTSGLDDNRNDAWFQFGGSAGPTYSGFNGVDFPAAMSLCANGNYLTAIVSPGATRSKILSATPSGSWTSVLSFPGSSTITSCNMVVQAGAIVAGFGAGGDPANTLIWYNTDGTGTTWNSQAVGTVIGAGCELIVKAGLLGASTGFIVIPLQPPVFETGTQFAYFTSLNGSTWTQRSLSGVIANTEVPTGLDFGNDGNGPCWILATQASNVQTNYYRSTDGVAWTTIGSTTTRLVCDLACVGNLWVATVVDATSTTPPGPIFGAIANPVYGAAGASYAIYSTDGAHTWHRSRAYLTKNLTSTGRQQRAKLARSNDQFCMFNSLQMRFSTLVAPAGALLFT